MDLCLVSDVRGFILAGKLPRADFFSRTRLIMFSKRKHK